MGTSNARTQTMKFSLVFISCLVAVSHAGQCSKYVSSVSTSGISTCDSDSEMPYPFAMHFHPTFDSDSGKSAYQLQEAFMQYFGVGDCDVAGENTLFPEDKDDQNICFMSTVVASGKCSTSGKGSETTFPECQYGIFVPSQLIFNTSLQASTADYTYTKKGSTQTYS